MTIKIEICANNVEGLRAQLRALLGVDTSVCVPPLEPKAVPVPVEDKPEPAPEEKRVSKKAEKKAEPVKKEETPVVQEAVVIKDFPATLDNCRVRIKEVCASDGKDGKAGGLDEAQKIITSFGVAKVGDLPKEKYADFIEECDKFLAKDPLKAKRGSKATEELFA